MGEQAVNEYQKAVAGTYGGGDFAHVADAATAKEFWDAVDGSGDTLFKFLMRELASPDCTSLDEAKQRMEGALRDVGKAVEALDTLEISAGLKV